MPGRRRLSLPRSLPVSLAGRRAVQRRLGAAGPLGALAARRGPLSRRSRQQLLAALGVRLPDRDGGSIAFLRRRDDGIDPPCPACRVADEETRRWFFFYETETNADTSVRGRLTASHGFCAAHTRRLLDAGTTASWLASSLFALLVDDALTDLPEPNRGRIGAPSAPCPVCASVWDRVGETLTVLAGCLDTGSSTADAEVVDAYSAGTGLCVPHARRFLSTAPASAVVTVAAQLADRLAATPEEAAPLLTGDDTDAPARERLRASAAPGVLDGDATARRAGLDRRIGALLDRPCCPVCAARTTAAWRLLDWIRSGAAAGRGTGAADDSHADADADADADSDRDAPDIDRHGGLPVPPRPMLVRRDGRPPVRPNPVASGVRQQLSSLCPTHLADLVAADGAGGWLSSPVATVVRLTAARWREAASALADPDAPRRHRAEDPLASRTSCPVCAGAAEAAQREVALLALVGADPARGPAVLRSHGPCRRCRPRVAALGAPGAGWVAATRARTAELVFELTEARRQRGWAARWDVAGDELTAWQRAPGHLDGAVLGPPPPRGRDGLARTGG